MKISVASASAAMVHTANAIASMIVALTGPSRGSMISCLSELVVSGWRTTVE
jgi:hypothetical protein